MANLLLLVVMRYIDISVVLDTFSSKIIMIQCYCFIFIPNIN